LCVSQVVTTSPVFEDGAEALVNGNISFGRDAFFTLYRIFILKKTFFETVKAQYLGCNVVVYDEELETLQIGTWVGSTTLTYENVTDLSEVTEFFEGTTYTTGCAVK